MNIDKKDIMKTAAAQLRTASEEIQSYRDTEELRKYAEEIILKTSESIPSNEVLKKVAELMNKDLEELKIINKAVELSKTGELHLGTVSDQGADNGSLDPLTALLVEDFLH